MDRSLYEKYPQRPAGKKCRKRLFKAAMKYNFKNKVQLKWEPCANGYGLKAPTGRTIEDELR
jgi:hypothetical protein